MVENQTNSEEMEEIVQNLRMKIIAQEKEIECLKTKITREDEKGFEMCTLLEIV